MITRTLYLLTLAAGLVTALVAGCGGKVIVDGVDNEGGQGGQGTSSTSGHSTNITVGVTSNISAGGSTCGFPAPIGDLSPCGGGTTTAGSGGHVLCSTQLCDKAGNIYIAGCADGSCGCSFDSADRTQHGDCSCALPTTCSNSPPCCPFIR